MKVSLVPKSFLEVFDFQRFNFLLEEMNITQDHIVQ